MQGLGLVPSMKTQLLILDQDLDCYLKLIKTQESLEQNVSKLQGGITIGIFAHSETPVLSVSLLKTDGRQALQLVLYILGSSRVFSDP